jgi:hypothetical protein
MRLTPYTGRHRYVPRHVRLSAAAVVFWMCVSMAATLVIGPAVMARLTHGIATSTCVYLCAGAVMVLVPAQYKMYTSKM